MHIALGSEIFGSDGEYFGSAEGVVVDSGPRRATRLLIGSGPLGGNDRMASLALVTSSADGRVVIQIDRQGAEQFPEYVKERYVHPDRVQDFPVILPAAGVGGPVIYDNPQTGDGYPGGDMFDPAPIDPPRLEVIDNLLTTEVMLPKGSDVESADGHKVGGLDELSLDSDGHIESIVVRAGFLFHHDLRLAASAIDEYLDHKITLQVSKDEAESHRA